MTISWVWNINSSTRFQGNVFASLTRTSNPYYTLLNSKGISPDQMNMSKIESEQSHYQKSVEQTSPGHVPTFLTSRWSNLPVVEERVNGRVKQNWGNVIHSSSLLIYIQRSFSVGHPGLLDTILLLWEGWRCSKHVLSAEGVWGRAGITCGEDSALSGDPCTFRSAVASCCRQAEGFKHRVQKQPVLEQRIPPKWNPWGNPRATSWKLPSEAKGSWLLQSTHIMWVSGTWRPFLAFLLTFQY